MKVKWLGLDNSTGQRSLKQHAFVPKVCRDKFTRDEYKGNVSLCGRCFASEDGEQSTNWKDLEQELLLVADACKICLNKINHTKYVQTH